MKTTNFNQDRSDYHKFILPDVLSGKHKSVFEKYGFKKGKVCNKCGEFFEDVEGNFRPNNRDKDGFSYFCKYCDRKYHKEWMRNIRKKTGWLENFNYNRRKKYATDPEWREKRKAESRDPEKRNRKNFMQREWLRKKMKEPEFAKKRSANHREWREKNRERENEKSWEREKERLKNPEYRAKRNERSRELRKKKYWEDLEWREHIKKKSSESLKRKMANPEERRKINENKRKAEQKRLENPEYRKKYNQRKVAERKKRKRKKVMLLFVNILNQHKLSVVNDKKC